MTRNFIRNSNLLFCLAAASTGSSLRAQIPFATNPTIPAVSATARTFFARKADGSYVQFSYGVNSPFPNLTDPTTLSGLLSGGLANLLAGPVGPSGVGRSSQLAA